jgi:hypothetical protein
MKLSRVTAEAGAKAQHPMLIVGQRSYAEHMAAELTEALENYFIDVTDNGAEAERLTGNKSYRWVIVDEKVPGETDTIEAKQSDAGNGAWDAFAFARSWVKAGKARRAIVITELLFPRVRLTDQVFAVERRRAFPCEGIADMIRAGDGDVTPIMPTVVRVRFSHRQSRRARNTKSVDRCVIEFIACCSGPLEYYFEDERSKRLKRRSHSDQFGDFGALSAQFQSLRLKEESGERLEAALKVARDLWDALPESGLMRWLLAIAEEARRSLFETPEPDPNRFPCPFLLQVVAKAEMTAVPLDLAISSDGGTGHICARIPVTWRIETENAPDATEDDRSWNRTSYRHFRAVSSCHSDCIAEGMRFRAVTDARKRMRKVLRNLGLPKSYAKHVRDTKSLQEVMKVEQQHRCCAYVLSHGMEALGIVVGPAPKDVYGAIVSAGELAPHSGCQRRRFVYFNCCDLGHQQTAQQFRSRYFGGFAHEMLQRGVCFELICNRWSVSADWACRLAEEFYIQRPSTAPGRAMALLNARVRIEEEMSRSAGGQIDPTWLAPIHMWSQ